MSRINVCSYCQPGVLMCYLERVLQSRAMEEKMEDSITGLQLYWCDTQTKRSNPEKMHNGMDDHIPNLVRLQGKHSSSKCQSLPR